MGIFRRLRWKLTLNYTLVTVSAFLVVTIILAIILLTRIFVSASYVTPEGLIEVLERNTSPLLRKVLSDSPVDTELLNLIFEDSDPQISGFNLLRIIALEFNVRTVADWRIYLISSDGILLAKTAYNYPTT